MDEHAGPLGLAELEQLHVESNSERSQYLYTIAPHTAGNIKLGKTRLQASTTFRTCRATADRCGVKQWA